MAAGLGSAVLSEIFVLARVFVTSATAASAVFSAAADILSVVGRLWERRREVVQVEREGRQARTKIIELWLKEKGRSGRVAEALEKVLSWQDKLSMVVDAVLVGLLTRKKKKGEAGPLQQMHSNTIIFARRHGAVKACAGVALALVRERRKANPAGAKASEVPHGVRVSFLSKPNCHLQVPNQEVSHNRLPFLQLALLPSWPLPCPANVKYAEGAVPTVGR